MKKAFLDALYARSFPDIRLYMNPFRILEYTALARQLPPARADSRTLDLGCGHGLQTCCLAKAGGEIVGLDPDEVAVRRAIKGAAPLKGRLPVSFLTGTLETAGFQDASFDRITSFSVIEHIPETEKVLRSCRRLLKPGGCMVFSMDGRLIADDPALEPLHRKAHSVCRYFDAADLPPLLESAGFRNVEVWSLFRSHLARRLFLGGLRSGFKYGFLETHTLAALLRAAEALTSRSRPGLFLLARAWA